MKNVINMNCSGLPDVQGDVAIPGLEQGMTVEYKTHCDDSISTGCLQNIVYSYTDNYLDVYYVINGRWIMNNEIKSFK